VIPGTRDQLAYQVDQDAPDWTRARGRFRRGGGVGLGGVELGLRLRHRGLCFFNSGHD